MRTLCSFQDDDGFIIYETRAIARYLATKYANQGTPLIPTELKAYARFEQAAAIETANFSPYAGGIAHEKFIKKYVSACQLLSV